MGFVDLLIFQLAPLAVLLLAIQLQTRQLRREADAEIESLERFEQLLRQL